MYRNIALVLLIGSVSVGGALALVIAQNSSVKRHVVPQTALVSPDFGTISPSAKRPARPVVGLKSPEVAAKPPLPTPPVAEAPARVSVPQSEPLVTAATPVDAGTQNFGPSTSEPNISPFAGLALDSLTTSQPAENGSLGLTEAPQRQFQEQELAKTWIIGVYR